MPFLLILLFVILVWMWMTYKARQRTRMCRWRENHVKDTAEGRYFECVSCGVAHFSPSGLPPAVCLRPESQDRRP